MFPNHYRYNMSGVLDVHQRKNISRGIGFLRRPELVVLSPLSLPASLLVQVLSRRSRSDDRIGMSAGNDGLPGLFSESIPRLGRDFFALRPSFDCSFSFLLGDPRLKRSIHDDAECGTWRASTDAKRCRDEERPCCIF